MENIQGLHVGMCINAVFNYAKAFAAVVAFVNLFRIANYAPTSFVNFP